jgi:metal-responsive CopG/Arc/MetJ family transcriptional regulator
MNEGDGLAEMETVTVELDEETVDAVDDIAFEDHRDNRAAAIRTLLDGWLKQRDDDPERE